MDDKIPIRLPRRVLRVAGQDAKPFLDGLLTNRVGEARAYAALLSPQGKLIADAFVWPDEHGVTLDIAETRADDLFKKLSLYKLRARVEIAPRPDLAVVANGAAFVGDDPQAWFAARRIVPADTQSGGSFAEYERQRIAAGAPDPAVDAAPEEVFALEALLEELHGVDFHKGCYVGQENVSRMKRRATTRRKFCRIAFDGPAPAYGTPITAGPATLGEMRSGTEGCAIALLRLDRALEALAAGEMLRAGERPLRLDPPPWLILPAVGAPEG